jgi:hypothetical protein
MKAVITTTQLFYALGQAERLTRDATLKAHKDYTKSTPEQQAQLMHDCLAQFIMGYLSTEDKPFTLKAAERILSQSRDDRTKDAQDAYYKGYSKFRYHIIRPEPETALPESSGRQVKVAVPKALVDSFVDEIINAGLTKAQVDALMTKVRDSIDFK